MADILKFNLENYKDQIDLKDKDYVDFHSKGTIVFGSLIEDGWDWGRNDWQAYNVSPEAMAILRPRINEKIEDRYFYRELGILPPAHFKRNLKSRLQDSVSAYGYLYEEVFKGLDFTSGDIEKLKQRETKSDYPQALLQTEAKDYLTSAEEEQYEKVITRNNLHLFMEFNEKTAEPDAKIIADLEICFSQIFSFNF